MKYPLGESVFVCVKTYRQRVRITLTEENAASISLSQKQFAQLMRVKERLCKEYNDQMSVLDIGIKKSVGKRSVAVPAFF